MKFICLGYMGEDKWKALSAAEREAMIEECFAYDEVLRKNGHWLDGGAALQGAGTARTLRYKSGAVLVTDGPYAETKEQLGGIGVLEAQDMKHAVELMSKHPGVRLGGPFEIRPGDEEINARWKQRSQVGAAGSKGALWAGRLMSALPALFLAFDAIVKLVKPAFVVEVTVGLGYPESVIVGLGVVLLASTVLYLVPRTAVLGAILLTGYLGGAVATHVRVLDGLFPIVFPVLVGALLWGGLCLRDERLRALIFRIEAGE